MKLMAEQDGVADREEPAWAASLVDTSHRCD